MLLENLLLGFGALIFILIILIIILIISKGFFKEIFKSENYIKFIQFIIVATLLFIFITIFIYFWINEVEVNNMAVIFTVTVGWLGLIIGAFFGQKFMESLTEEKRKLSGKEMIHLINRYKTRINLLLKIIRKNKKKIKNLKK